MKVHKLEVVKSPGKVSVIHSGYSWGTVGVQLEYSWGTVGVQLGYSWGTVGVQLEYATIVGFLQPKSVVVK